MMMLIGPSHSRGAHDFRAPREWRAPMKVFFSRGPGSVDSWTPGPKPLCHRRPTGPHPSGLLWTPAKGDSTKSNFALEAELLEVGRAAVEVGGVLERLADLQHVALHVGLAEDLDADRQAVREAARHRQAAQAEIVAGPRELGRDRRGLVDFAERDRRA